MVRESSNQIQGAKYRISTFSFFISPSFQSFSPPILPFFLFIYGLLSFQVTILPSRFLRFSVLSFVSPFLCQPLYSETWRVKNMSGLIFPQLNIFNSEEINFAIKRFLFFYLIQPIIKNL